MQISAAALKEFAPHARDDYVAALADGGADLAAVGIVSQIRLCHFLAQTAHETGGYSIVREATNWTPEQVCALFPSRFKTKLDPRILACRGDEEKLANLIYSNRTELGNMGGDDGWAYRGGGFLQLTGRANYHEAGSVIGVDLEGEPELIEDARVSLKAALFEWAKLNLNALADRNYCRAIGNAINRGNAYAKGEPTGAVAREQWLARAWALFGQGPLPNPSELAIGASGPMVGRLQGRLKELGYGIGNQDQVYGPTLARAVAAFKLDAKRHNGAELEPDDVIGPATWKALEMAPPAYVSPDRQQATEHTLVALGSTEVFAGQQQKAAGSLALVAGIAGGAQQTGLGDGAMAVLSSLPAAKSSLVPVIDAIQWGLKHALWVLMAIGGVWFWMKGRQVIEARLEAHRNGSNLAR